MTPAACERWKKEKVKKAIYKIEKKRKKGKSKIKLKIVNISENREKIMQKKKNEKKYLDEKNWNRWKVNNRRKW